MRWFRWLLLRLPRFDVGDGQGDIFFSRYDLLKTRWFAVYLHEFYRSDNDRCLHDHTWPFTTIILRGGYWEVVPIDEGCGRRDAWQDFGIGGWEDWRLAPTERLWRPLGYVGRYSARHAHRIEVDPEKPKPWSLVIVGRKSRAWGFWGPGGWIKWEKGHPNPICEREGV
jgi:hypothetical protein